MRPFRFLPKCLQILLIANVLVFGLQLLGGHAIEALISGFGGIIGYGVFFQNGDAYINPQTTSLLEPWRYVTYMFIHGGGMHLFFNMMMLWMFGSEIADMMGEKKFLGLYFFCGIFAGLFSLLFYLTGAISMGTVIVGASGALMGVFVAYYRFFPERTILMFFFFPMKIKYAMWIMIGLDVLFANSGDSIAHFTHMGGVLAGFLYMFAYEGGFKRLFRRKPKVSSWSRESNDDDVEVLEGEVEYLDENRRMDEILKKVSREGLQSLTDSERKFLLKAGDNIRRRRGGM